MIGEIKQEPREEVTKEFILEHLDFFSNLAGYDDILIKDCVLWNENDFQSLDHNINLDIISEQNENIIKSFMLIINHEIECDFRTPLYSDSPALPPTPSPLKLIIALISLKKIRNEKREEIPEDILKTAARLLKGETLSNKLKKKYGFKMFHTFNHEMKASLVEALIGKPKVMVC